MGGGTLETAEGPAAGSVSVLAVDHFVAAPDEAVVEVVSAVGLDVAGAVVDKDVVAGTADEVGRGHRAGDLEGVVAAVAHQRHAVDVEGADAVIAGVAADD